MGSPRLTKIDQLVLSDYHYLTEEDECYFLREFTSRAGYQHSESNNLVFNFKKGVDRRGRGEWKWKEHAIEQLGDELRSAVNDKFLQWATLVPMPPSKAKSDPLYDDRLVRLIQRMTVGLRVDVRELLVRGVSGEPAHTSDDRPDPTQIAGDHRIDSTLTFPPPDCIALFDDVLTTGAHFRAACRLFDRAFPGVRVVGFFVARRIFHDTSDKL